MDFLETVEVSLISATFASFLTYYFSFLQYLRQRKREEIRREYIENGLDYVIENIDKGFFICHFNYEKAVRIIEYLEKSLGDVKIEKDITQKIFLEMEPLVVAPENSIYKLEFLTGDDNISSSFLWIIGAMADCLKYNDYLRYELFFELEYYFNHPEKFQDKKIEFFQELQKRVKEIYGDAISKNELLKVHLLKIKRRINEIAISDIKDFKKFPKDKKMQEILIGMQNDYENLNTK